MVVTGEHSGIENPNMPAALAAVGVTTFAEDASRQPQQYSLGAALGAPRYPSNIYYNAANWPDQLNEYNTLYVAQGDSLGSSTYPSETGHCTDTSATTCRATAATEADLLASESHIMLSHVLANNPRVGYAHQSNLIGPATQNGQDYGYTLLTLINNMLSQYNTWYNTNSPLDQMTDPTSAQTLAEQGAWATASKGGQVSATVQNGVVTVTNGGSEVKVPVTVPAGTTVNGGAAFGQSYGGDLSDWVDLGNGATETLNENVGPAITSAASASSIVGTAFSFTVTTTGAPTPSLTETGSLPAGVSFKDNGDGTATISGTPASGSGGSYPIQITAANSVGGTTQSFTLTSAEAPTITSPGTATFSTGVAGTYTVTTTGSPVPSITESGALPSGMTFKDNKDGTATISGTPANGSQGTYPVTLSATNSSGSTATLSLTITVNAAAPPTITSGSVADFTLNQAGAVAVTTTGAPTPTITESGTLPDGLTFTDNGNGTALLSGTPTATGTTNLTITASNGIQPERHPGLHGRGRPGPRLHQRRDGHGHGRIVVLLHRQGGRIPGSELGRFQPAAGGYLHRQQGRHGHPVRHADHGGHLRGAPHRHQRLRLGAADADHHHRAAPGHHQRQLGHLHRRNPGDVLGDHHRQSHREDH